MVLDHETARDDGAAGEVKRADLQVVDVLAAAALEVIVMTEAGALVAGLAVGEDNGLDAVRLEQEIEGAIHGGDAEAAEGLTCACKDLLDRDRAFRLGDGFEDGIALACVTLAERGWHGRNVTAGRDVAQGKGNGGILDFGFWIADCGLRIYCTASWWDGGVGWDAWGSRDLCGRVCCLFGMLLPLTGLIRGHRTGACRESALLPENGRWW
jgi:hypothetical protein